LGDFLGDVVKKREIREVLMRVYKLFNYWLVREYKRRERLSG